MWKTQGDRRKDTAVESRMSLTCFGNSLSTSTRTFGGRNVIPSRHKNRADSNLNSSQPTKLAKSRPSSLRHLS